MRNSPLSQGLEIESQIDPTKHRYVIGVDEVGRGSWAGPLCVGAVVVEVDALLSRAKTIWEKEANGEAPLTPLEESMMKITDSKLLPSHVRSSLINHIETVASEFGLGYVQAWEIDGLGMTQALALGAQRAMENMDKYLDSAIILLDGNTDFIGGGEVRTLLKGDRRSFAIASASIYAKVKRDDQMILYSDCYPWYRFESNKGYPSGAHVCAINAMGLSNLHRKSWSYVNKLPWSNLHSSFSAMSI
ncbi:MAG: ribonuclease HII [Actinobacteria bacterium]|nr:ribonuclease HII [Actinomycetota bacterium]